MIIKFSLPLILLASGALAGCQRGSLADSKNETTAAVYQKILEGEEDFENGESLKNYSRPKVVHLPAKR